MHSVALELRIEFGDQVARRLEQLIPLFEDGPRIELEVAVAHAPRVPSCQRVENIVERRRVDATACFTAHVTRSVDKENRRLVRALDAIDRAAR